MGIWDHNLLRPAAAWRTNTAGECVPYVAPASDELAHVKGVAREMLRREKTAERLIEAALVEYGASRHPLVDALLDVRNVLRAR